MINDNKTKKDKNDVFDINLKRCRILREGRKMQSLTPSDLAELTGETEDNILQMESGMIAISDEYYAKLLKLLDIREPNIKENVTEKDFLLALASLKEFCGKKACGKGDECVFKRTIIRKRFAWNICTVGIHRPDDWICTNQDQFPEEAVDIIISYCLKTQRRCSQCPLKMSPGGKGLSGCLFDIIVPEFVHFDTPAHKIKSFFASPGEEGDIDDYEAEFEDEGFIPINKPLS